jgi:intracellular protein transport protein USO1
LQAGFAQLEVPEPAKPGESNTNGSSNGVATVHIIDALLNIVIAAPNSPPFNVRLAACQCIQAYFTGHSQIRLYFLDRAIKGHLSGEDETANILSTVLWEGAMQGSDPYRIWFGSVLLMHLIWEDPQAKSLLMQVSEGDAESGEELVTCIQTVAGNLAASIQRDEDERVPIAYLMLLCTWLTEDQSAVNDLLGEASLLQSLIQAVSTNSCTNTLIKGLCALLIGVLYHYSTKDSPIPRRKLHPILTTGMGREKYLHALSELRKHPFIRDFEVYSQGSRAASSSSDKPLPYAYLDAAFIEYLKDNFSKFCRAVDRDPGIEVQAGVATGEQGFDRDLVDTLRAELEERNTALDHTEARILDLEQKLDTAQAVHRKESETAASELTRFTNLNDTLQKAHDLEVAKMNEGHKAIVVDLQRQLAELQKAKSEEAERTKDYYERALAQSRNLKSGLDTRLGTAQRSLDETTRAHESAKKTIIDLKDENSSWKKAIDSSKAASERKDRRLSELQQNLTKQKDITEDETTKVTMLEKEVSELEASLKKLKTEMAAARTEVQEKEKAREATQTELDDLLMVFADVEEKRGRDKVNRFITLNDPDMSNLLQKRLKELGEEVSEAEEEDDDDDDELD